MDGKYKETPPTKTLVSENAIEVFMHGHSTALYFTWFFLAAFRKTLLTPHATQH
jgi:hypothetical protein